MANVAPRRFFRSSGPNPEAPIGNILHEAFLQRPADDPWIERLLAKLGWTRPWS